MMLLVDCCSCCCNFVGVVADVCDCAALSAVDRCLLCAVAVACYGAVCWCSLSMMLFVVVAWCVLLLLWCESVLLLFGDV